MAQIDPPAKAASNAVLGPLPEPAAKTTRYEVAPPGQGSAMYPVGTLRACGRVAVGYAADQMSAYAAAEVARAVAAERERWRALLEARAAGCERAAENTDDTTFDAMARLLMSVREDGSRA